MNRVAAGREAERGLDRKKFVVSAKRVRGRCRITITRRADLARLLVADAATWAQADAQRRSGFRAVTRDPRDD